MSIQESNSIAHLQNIWTGNLNDFYGKTYFIPMIKPINQFLINHNRLQGDLLEIGCGFGDKSNIFSKIGFNVTGIDSSLERINRATVKFPNTNFFYYEIKSQLPFEDNSFDVVFSNSVFQYLDHVSIISECKRILKNGGCLILIENLRNNPITRLGRAWLKFRKYNYQSYPFNHFTYPEINSITNDFNESELSFHYFLSPIAHAKFANKLFTKLNAIDNHLLKLRFFKKLSWLTLFIGLNKK